MLPAAWLLALRRYKSSGSRAVPARRVARIQLNLSLAASACSSVPATFNGTDEPDLNG
jgi:hypothetical protein